MDAAAPASGGALYITRTCTAGIRPTILKPQASMAAIASYRHSTEVERISTRKLTGLANPPVSACMDPCNILGCTYIVLLMQV